MDFSKLDSLLSALPPPPKPKSIVPYVRTRFLFVGPPISDEKAIYPKVDENHMLISNEARSIPNCNRSNVVLMGLNMKLNKTVVHRSPRFISELDGKCFPKTTDIACWWCRHKFDTQPIGIPYKRFERINYRCFGNYCSYECGMAAAVDSHSVQIKLFAGSLLCLMRKTLSGTPLANPLKRAHHWSSLKAYGGVLSIEEFRKNVMKVETIPENVRLFPVGFNIFIDKRKTYDIRKKRKTNLVFEAKERSKIMRKKKKTTSLVKTNFSHIKLRLKKTSSKSSKLTYKAPKKERMKLF